jgi:hypothetical protein
MGLIWPSTFTIASVIYSLVRVLRQTLSFNVRFYIECKNEVYRVRNKTVSPGRRKPELAVNTIEWTGPFFIQATIHLLQQP